MTADRSGGGGQLGRRAGVTVQSMQATIQALHDLGAVGRHSPPGRGRTAELHVTATGYDLLKHGQRVIAMAD